MSLKLCPYNVHTELHLVEYPGFVRNVEKMIETLGGITKISQVLSGEQKRLELKFHPRNPFNKLINGDVQQNAGVLLRIIIRHFRKDRKKQSTFKIDFVGHSRKIYIFDTLCDFQYLPIVKNVSTDKPEYILSSVVPRSITDIQYFFQENSPLLCVPHIFGRADSVYPNIHRYDSVEDDQTEVLGVFQKATYDSRDVVVFNLSDIIPTRPDPQIVKRMKVKYVSDEQLELVKKLFDKCPIWTRIALLYESGISNDKLKCIIPSLAYYFSTGPWRTLYIRYGYDPRRHFESRYYQTFDFRLRFRSGVAEYVNVRKLTKKKKLENPGEINALVQDIDYPYFEEDKLPRSRQCIFRYCDVKIQKIEDMLNKIPSPLAGATCNEKTGWLPPGFDGQVRQIMGNLIKDLVCDYYQKRRIKGADCDDYADDISDDNEPDPDTEISDSGDDVEENLERTMENMQIDGDLLREIM